MQWHAGSFTNRDFLQWLKPKNALVWREILAKKTVATKDGCWLSCLTGTAVILRGQRVL